MAKINNLVMTKKQKKLAESIETVIELLGYEQKIEKLEKQITELLAENKLLTTKLVEFERSIAIVKANSKSDNFTDISQCFKKGKKIDEQY